jgi:LDH2 family malate/lactate/ureidoglycolate dehydrogenase
MDEITGPARRIVAATLQDLVTRLFIAAGVPAEDAALVADTLVKADLWGHSSHGVLRAPWYLDRIANGVMTPVTKPERVVDAGAIALWDGKDGVGQVITRDAMQAAIAKAKQHGVGIVSVRYSNHHGALGYYTRVAAAEGCIGMLAANGGPAMAPWGGRTKVLGNNPWSIATPAGRHPPIVLDMANTLVARGKIFVARQKGVPIPEGWAIDAEGRPTTDPVAALGGVILPMAEHKGYAITLMMDVLAGALSGSQVLTGVNSPFHTDKRSGAGHFVLALDVAKFGPLAEYEARIEAMIAEIKAAPRAAGVAEIFYPGEMEARNEERHQREGLDLPVKTIQDLGDAARKLGVAMPEEWR